MEEDNTCRAVEKIAEEHYKEQTYHRPRLICSNCGEELALKRVPWERKLYPSNFCQNCGKRIVGSVLLEDGTDRDPYMNIPSCAYTSKPVGNYCEFCGQKLSGSSFGNNTLPTVTGSSTSVSS